MADGGSDHHDKLTASTAILAAVSAATLASNVQATADDSSGPKREFGTVTYERVLPHGDCRCVERTSKKLQSLDNVVHVWVRDARTFRHGLESAVPYFSLRVAATIPVRKLRGLVQEKFAQLSPYRQEVDGELQLCFDDRMLDDEEVFSSYLPRGGISTSAKTGHGGSARHWQPSWPKPFVGILWVLPWRPSRKHPPQWGSGETLTAAAHSSKTRQTPAPQSHQPTQPQ